MPSARLLIAGLSSLFLASCGGKFILSEVCFVDANRPSCVCFVADKPDAQILPLAHCDRYQAMRPDDASRVKGFINKCLKAGVRP